MNDRQPAFGINFYGHVTGNFGLAVAARNTLLAMRANDVDACVVDIDAGGGRSGHDDTYSSLACASPSGTFPISLFHTNPTDVYSYAIETPASTWAPDRLRILVPFWELPLIPEGLWTEFISAMDMVLAPTLFIAEAIRTRCPQTNVVHYPQAVFLPDGVAPDRARFGMPESAFVCVTVMDASSGFERKNPFASVTAFREAFGDLGPDEVRLVVKMTDRRGAREFSGQLEEFREQAESDPRILVIEESMSYRDVLSLNASADVLLSLHRAEGLGLNLMEAMSLGTVVLGTAWSGNMDFMTAENSILVGCNPTPVESAHPSYAPEVVGEGQYWMEPDGVEAAAGLRRLYDDRALLASLAEQARSDMDAARGAFLRCEWAGDVHALFDAGTLGSAEHAARSAAFAQVMRVNPLRRMRRGLGNVARRFGML
ncbi:MAG: glycosyltransferase [Coriobacteriia bacterium]|nr:glycosyltransferase [Coriobacteriia bacterium]